MTRTGSPTPPERSAPRAWWAPLAFVMLSFVVLTVVPLLVSIRVRRLRRDVVDVSGPAGVLINDDEADLTLQMLALSEIREGLRTTGLERWRTAVAEEARDEARLDSLARLIGPDAVERLVELRTESAHWHAMVLPFLEAPTPLPPSLRPLIAASDSSASVVLASADRVEALVDSFVLAQRARIRALERVDVQLPAVLAPLALFSGILVFLLSRRTLALAEQAEAGRRALARAAEAKATLMRGVTHDIKNPLGAAAGYAELLGDGVLGELTTKQRDVLERVRRLVGLSLETVNELLELSRAESGTLEVTATPTDIAALMCDVVEDYRAVAQSSALALTAEIDPALPVIRTDPARVRQVMGNLLTNAVKYTPAGGCVRVQATRQARDGRVVIAVADSGRGIPARDRDRIFEEFFRLPTAGGGGTGIGLAIGRRIARLLGGDLTVRDAEGGGAEFRLELPVG